MDVREEIRYHSKLLKDTKDDVDDDTITLLLSGAMIALVDFCTVMTPSVAVLSENFQTLIKRMYEKITVFLAMKNLTEEQKFNIFRYKEELDFFEESTNQLAKCTDPATNEQGTREECVIVDLLTDSCKTSLVCTAYPELNEPGTGEECATLDLLLEANSSNTSVVSTHAYPELNEPGTGEECATLDLLLEANSGNTSVVSTHAYPELNEPGTGEKYLPLKFFTLFEGDPVLDEQGDLY